MLHRYTEMLLSVSSMSNLINHNIWGRAGIVKRRGKIEPPGYSWAALFDGGPVYRRPDATCDLLKTLDRRKETVRKQADAVAGKENSWQIHETKVDRQTRYFGLDFGLDFRAQQSVPAQVRCGGLNSLCRQARNRPGSPR